MANIIYVVYMLYMSVLLYKKGKNIDIQNMFYIIDMLYKLNVLDYTYTVYMEYILNEIDGLNRLKIIDIVNVIDI